MDGAAGEEVGEGEVVGATAFLWVEETGEEVGETMWGAGVTAAAEAAETRKKRGRRVAGSGGMVVRGGGAGGMRRGELKGKLEVEVGEVKVR